MLKILLVTRRKETLSEFIFALESRDDVDFSWVESGEKALNRVKEAPFDLLVADEKLADMTGLQLASRVVMLNPMINCAAISSLSAKDFHEASEGLGLMAQLPPKPGAEQAKDLLGRLKEIKSLEAEVSKQ